MSQTITESAKVAAIRVRAANKYIFRALLSLSSAALFVRVTGMLNQVVASKQFGAGAVMDGYFVAYTLPTVLAYLIIGAIEAAVIPVYSRARLQKSKEETSRLFSTILNLFMLSSLLLTVLLIIFHRQMVFLTAPALDQFRANTAADLALFMDPVLFLMVVVGLLESIFNVEGQFGWPAYAGILVPLTTAVLVVFLGNSQGVVVLCIGMVLGLCLQLGAFTIRARHAQLVYRPVLDLRTPEIGSIFVAIWPVFLGGLIAQASPLVDQIFASLLSTGSISALSYSLKIVSIFSGVIFASVGRAILPYLSRQAAASDMKAFKETLRLYLWTVGLGTVVLSVLMLLLAHPIVHILFQRGAFTADDTSRTATTLVGFVFGLTPMALGYITARAFSAIGKNRVLMGVSVFSVVANAVFDYIFARFWQSQGIALSTSAVYFCTMLILFTTLSRMIGKLNLLTPPTEVIQLINKLRFTLLSLFPNLRQQIIRFGIAMLVFAVGTLGMVLDSAYTVRIALGSVVVVALLRFRYALLIAWVILDVFIGSTISIFNGNHFDTGLSASTLLLMTCLPWTQTFKRFPTLAFLFVYLIWVLAGIGISPLGIGAFLTQWILLLDYIAVAILTIHVLTTKQRLMRFIDIIMVPATFVALYGIYGYVTKQNGLIDHTTLQFRIYSIFDAAPGAALYFSIIIPLAIYRSTILRGFKRVIMSIIVILFITTLVLTFTRAALISLPLSIIIMILFIPSRKVKISLFTGILVLAVVAFFVVQSNSVPFLDRFFNGDILTFDNRIYLWQALLSHFDPKQLLGNGYRASDILLVNLGLSNFGPSPSNLFIGALYDSGLIGLALLVIVFIALFVNVFKGIRKTSGDRRALFVVALATLVNILLQSFDANDLWTQSIGLYFWVIIALPFALYWSPLQSLRSDDRITDQVTVPQLEAVQSVKREIETYVPY